MIPSTNPFLKSEFLNSLTESGCVGAETGWKPAFIQDNGVLINYEKTHSYGEYIFDWSWAEAYERYGIPYYPKLTSMIPFTPVTTRHFLNGNNEHLLNLHETRLLEGPFSSSHFLFLDPGELELFRNQNYLMRESFQYHFFNEGYSSFDDVLAQMKTKKAKNLRSERVFKDLSIKNFTGPELTQEHAEKMYAFYISTIVNKNSFDYLNEKFFKLIFERMPENILYIEASENNEAVAGSLFFYDSEKLYGRYWGSNRYIENLHFELCYYQGIDFCIDKKLKVFEAGAQGEHKISRGFRPVRTYSAHKIKHPAFNEAISTFVQKEKLQIELQIKYLEELLPFRNPRH